MGSSPASPLAPNGGNTHLSHSALQRTKEQNSVEIFENGVDETKALAGKIGMVWRDGDQVEALVSIPPLLHEKSRDNHIFSIIIKLEPAFMAAVNLQPDDEFRLSLRGGVRKNKANSRKKSTLLMCLFFTKGIHLEWGRAGGDWKTLNTWILNHDVKAEDGNSWYMSPSKSADQKSLVPAKRRHVEEEDTGQANEAMSVDVPAEEGKKLSKSEKKRRRMEGKLRKAPKEPPQASEPLVTPSVVAVHPSIGLTSAEPQIGVHESEEVTPAQQWQSGSTKAILQLEMLPFGTIVNLIGIAISCSTPKTTVKGEWSVCIEIIDPSSYHQNLKVNCFTPRHAGWLPCPHTGDIIILRNVKKQSFGGGFNCVGYGNRTQWAIYAPPGKIHYGPPSNAPEREGLGRDGEGYPFSPFYKATAEDIMCCTGLSDWWRGHEQSNMPQQHANATSTSMPSGKPVARVHRLIKDASPDLPPDGYFDCTVEVVKGFSSGYAYSLYVTDYTKNEFTLSVQTQWCPATLSDQVLLVSMWDSAAEKAPSMKPGQIYSITNMKMKRSQQGHLEARLNQSNGVTLLSKDEIAFNENVKALLERKKAWEIEQSSKEFQIEQKLIENVEEDKFFHCTVEMLQPVRRPSGELPHIYITDYTPHQLLRPLVVDEPWARGLKGYIVKITLDNEQQEMADALEAGSFYCIRKLRLKKSPLDEYMKGNLGGNEKKLVKLNPEKAGNEHLNALLRRKEFWENHHPRKEQPPRDEDEPVLPLKVSPTTNDSGYKLEHSSSETRSSGMKIKDFPSAREQPVQLTVHAKVVSYYPMELRDAVVRVCSRCRTRLLPIQLACNACADLDQEYVQATLVLGIILEDEDGAQILITVDNSCDAWCNLNLRNSTDEAILVKFWDKIKPCLGNLPEVHRAYSQGGTLPKVCPFYTFKLKSWAAPGGNRGYKLINYLL